MIRPDKLIRLIAIQEAIRMTPDDKHHTALHALSVDIINDISDEDHKRITQVRRQLSKAASELMLEWAEDTP